MVLDISFSVNKKKPVKWVRATSLTEGVYGDKLIYLAIKGGDC